MKKFVLKVFKSNTWSTEIIKVIRVWKLQWTDIVAFTMFKFERLEIICSPKKTLQILSNPRLRQNVLTSSPWSIRSFSCSISLAMHSLIASLQARWQISVKSAPEKPLVTRARCSISTSGSTGDLRRLALKIDKRDPSSGSGMYINWSKRPRRMIFNLI